MASGYTAKIADGITFKEYALTCARAFGATIEMRDEPLGTPIPDAFKPSTYHRKAVYKTAHKLARIQLMSKEDCKKEAAKEYSENQAYYTEQIKKNADLKIKYDNMLAEAKKYQAPSREHRDFKAFMISQIVSSIEHDCGGNYYQNALTNLKKLSGHNWKQREIAQCYRDLVYHAKNQAKDNASTKNKNDWIKLLRKSLATHG